jgi:hypothetical protein
MQGADSSIATLIPGPSGFFDFDVLQPNGFGGVVLELDDVRFLVERDFRCQRHLAFAGAVGTQPDFVNVNG